MQTIKIKGKVWKYGDDIDTDVIIPGKYMGLSSLQEQLPHTLEGIDPNFTKKISPGDILVAGNNFGCGSSRETAATLLKLCGLGAIIAESFSRIFFRNAINQGLLVVQCEGITKYVDEGDIIKYSSYSGLIVNETKSKKLKASSIPEFLHEILTDGGAIKHFRKKLQ